MVDVLYKIENSLLHCLKELSGRVESVEKAVKEALERLRQPMQIAVIGRISSSKSTLVNAFLGDPDIARTDRSEETFNVSWIKYGSENEGITIVLRNGSRIPASRESLPDWTGRTGRLSGSAEISHIEVPVENDILKDINIIDTPGLDSAYGKDSENTVRFLREVKPDAVLMVFSRSISNDTLDTLREFQKKFSSDVFGLSPMNALGVMGKVDELWKITEPDKTALDRGENVVRSLKDSYPEILEIFQNLYPVSALMGLGAETLTEEEFTSLKSLIGLPPQLRIITFAGVSTFLKENPAVDLSASQRKALLSRLGLYGIFEAVRVLEASPECDITKLKTALLEAGGLDRVRKAVISHFGKRAAIIKSRNAVLAVLHSIGAARAEIHDTNLAFTLEAVYESLTSAMLSIRQYDVWDLLARIYDKKFPVTDESAVDDLRRVAGENGHSIMARLGLSSPVPAEQMVMTARTKSDFWASKYVMSRLRNRREKSKLYRILCQSFNSLAEEVATLSREIEEAERILKTNRQLLFT